MEGERRLSIITKYIVKKKTNNLRKKKRKMLGKNIQGLNPKGKELKHE
jgi:hypothetical protein